MNTTTMTLAELRQQPHWSYSSLHSLLQVCGLQWAFGHVYEQEPAFTPVSLALGKAFHRACAQLTLLRRDGPGLPLKEAQELFAAAWKLECAIAEPPLSLIHI